MNLLKSVCSVLFCIAWSALLEAQSVPPLVNYQGRLANPDGSPLPTADYELSFRVWDAATNGMLMWGPQIFDGAPAQGHGARIPVMQGYFNVILGPVDTNGVSLADAFTNSNRYVEVTLSNRPPILLRQQILSTPFALRAEHAGNRVVGTNAGLGGVAVSPTVSHISTATVPTLVPDLAVMIETSGRPVQVFLSAGTNGYAHIEAYDPAGGGLARAFLSCGGTEVCWSEDTYWKVPLTGAWPKAPQFPRLAFNSWISLLQESIPTPSN